MTIKLDDYQFYCSYDNTQIPPENIPVIFLHGFTGSSTDWQKICPAIDSRFAPVSIDLFGHGQSDSPTDISYYGAEGITTQIDSVFKHFNISNAILCGYSMGGRAALAFSLKYPAKVKALILESSTAGIDDVDDRSKRKVDDFELALRIDDLGVEKFIDYWLNLPIFSSQKSLPTQIQKMTREQKLKNSPVGLINSLKGFSSGVMQSYWGQLQNLNCPVQLIAGELDTKYVQINQSMFNNIKNAEFEIIRDCGHNTHLEKPREFVSLLNRFIGIFFE